MKYTWYSYKQVCLQICITRESQVNIGTEAMSVEHGIDLFGQCQTQGPLFIFYH